MTDFIVAIELGSTKITGIAGKKNLDGSISILAVAEEDATSCIRKGVVYNIDKTVLCLSNIIKKLETKLKTKIAKAYVGVGGQSVLSLKNIQKFDFEVDTKVTQEMIDSIKDTNRNNKYPEKEILDSEELEYRVDTQLQKDPVGIQCKHLEGNFLNILSRSTFYENIDTAFKNAKITFADLFLAPRAMADFVLTENEKRSGCLLVDLGADTTTVQVYYRDKLRHLAVIPLGGNNITKDIASLQMEEKDAEAMKLKYGSAFTDENDIDENLNLQIDQDRTVSSRKFIEIVEARVTEIVENVWNQVPNEFMNKLLCGIILTGGGSKMRNIGRAFTTNNRNAKVRIAKTGIIQINSSDPMFNAPDGTMNTVLGLLAKGNDNCAGKEIKPDIFDPESTVEGVKPQTHDTAMTGRVKTLEEKRREEEEQRRLAEEAERERLIKEEEERRRLEEERKQNSPWRKLHKKVSGFLDQILKDDAQ